MESTPQIFIMVLPYLEPVKVFELRKLSKLSRQLLFDDQKEGSLFFLSKNNGRIAFRNFMTMQKYNQKLIEYYIDPEAECSFTQVFRNGAASVKLNAKKFMTASRKNQCLVSEIPDQFDVFHPVKSEPYLQPIGVEIPGFEEEDAVTTIIES